MQGEEINQNQVIDHLKSVSTPEVTEGLLRGEKNGISDGPYTLDELMGEEFRPKDTETEKKEEEKNPPVTTNPTPKHLDSLKQNTGIPTAPFTQPIKKIDVLSS
ncbi:MAG: hypothetical protein UR93_C0017G0004 [Berkelbacteria bacterium GW2011_GWA2_35_9]|uniref:Uncharacterized protein n=1 Tax=Berkelbacteria bacterium GW2011_GWA2_35_9 TaxID=1618333 RepID=A0A0G0D203_9BACT|nr:MAG: hypothetical protein UR93_C0017G0004 [Berkelbacteria bacterium GW2011_GWA2_35_9]